MNNKPNFYTALSYYSRSIPTLFQIQNIWNIIPLFFGKVTLIKLKNGLKFYIECVMDVWVIKEVILDTQYEKYHQIHKGDTVVDIGAAFGDFSIHAARKAKKVYAYDPNTHRLDLMNKNILVNKSINIKILNKTATSLDEVFKENNIVHCNFLKIDCEGAEYEILSNASVNTLSKIDYIAMEIHLFSYKMRKEYPEMKKCLEKNGFFLIEEENPVHGYLKQLFAVRKNKNNNP